MLYCGRGTCLPTFDSSHSMIVLISVYRLTKHWLFQGRTPASGTEVSLLRDRACGHLAIYTYADLGGGKGAMPPPPIWQVIFYVQP